MLFDRCGCFDGHIVGSDGGACWHCGHIQIRPGAVMAEAVVILSRYQLFLAWARDNYSGYEFDEVLNRYCESGDFPEDFNLEFSGEVMAWL